MDDMWSVAGTFVFYGYGDHRDLHVLTHSFPPRRSSDLLPQCSAPARSAQDGAIRAGRNAAAITASQLPYLRNSQSASGPIGSPYFRRLRCSISATTPGSSSARSEEHTSELQSRNRTSYAVFCLKKKDIMTEPVK